MKVVFIGSADFSVLSFEKLLSSSNNVLALVTSPDKKSGRGLRVKTNRLKTIAVKNNIPVLQPRKISEKGTVDEILAFKPDAIVVAAYGQKIPNELLFTPPYKCINVHGSLLPRWRGASPIQYAILDGDSKTGITTMLMEEKMDTGPMLLQEEILIDDKETAKSLHDKLAVLGAQLLIETLDLLERDKINPIPQNEEDVTLAKKIKKENGILDFSSRAGKIERIVRAFHPWPGCCFFVDGVRVKIIESVLCDDLSDTDNQPGYVISSKPSDGLLVQTGGGIIRLKTVQPEGKKKMSDIDFINGRRHVLGNIL